MRGERLAKERLRSGNAAIRSQHEIYGAPLLPPLLCITVQFTCRVGRKNPLVTLMASHRVTLNTMDNRTGMFSFAILGPRRFGQGQP